MQCFYFQTSIVKQDLDYDLKKKNKKDKVINAREIVS
jgi:hypothetical protein